MLLNSEWTRVILNACVIELFCTTQGTNAHAIVSGHATEAQQLESSSLQPAWQKQRFWHCPQPLAMLSSSRGLTTDQTVRMMALLSQPRLAFLNDFQVGLTQTPGRIMVPTRSQRSLSLVRSVTAAYQTIIWCSMKQLAVAVTNWRHILTCLVF